MAERLTVAGVGVGPFNLSLAALLQPLQDVAGMFYERRPVFDWHPGMLLPGSRMQTSFLKDLVTPVDPTSRFGFLSYLVSRGQLYRFLNAEYPRIHRAEYANYLSWVANQLGNLSFGREVREVTLDAGGFRLVFDNLERSASQHMVVAAGLAPHIPPGAERALGPQCLHSHDYMTSRLATDGERVLLIGGGQSSAEIFLDLLSGRRGQPRSVEWITRRDNLSPLDESPFTNEYFTPDYVRSFHRLPEARRRRMLPQLKLAGDGISPITLAEIYQRLYELDCLEGSGPAYRILPHREARQVRRLNPGFEVEVHNAFAGADERLTADVVVLATGYRYRMPACLTQLAERMERDADDVPVLRADYSARMDAPSEHRLYMQNAGHRTHGIADAQLSLAAWRAAVICNALAGRSVYAIETMAPTLRWHSEDGASVPHTRGRDSDGATPPHPRGRDAESAARAAAAPQGHDKGAYSEASARLTAWGPTPTYERREV